MMQDAAGGHLSSIESSDSNNEQIKEITAPQAWELLQQKKAILVDVRTEQELPDYGKPDLAKLGGESLLIPWRVAPDFQVNMQFIDQLRSSVSPDIPVLFICKIGGRSYEAALAAKQAGYAECYNILGGMDGENGWKASGLDWGQV